jgi:hypothetical protein
MQKSSRKSLMEGQAARRRTVVLFKSPNDPPEDDPYYQVHTP